MKTALQVLTFVMGSTLAISIASAQAPAAAPAAPGPFSGCTDLSGDYMFGDLAETYKMSDCSTVTITVHETHDEVTVLQVPGVRSIGPDQGMTSVWINGQLVQTPVAVNADGSVSSLPMTTSYGLNANKDLTVTNAIGGQSGAPAILKRK